MTTKNFYLNGGMIGKDLNFVTDESYQTEATVPRSEQQFTTVGTTSWTVPTGVTAISAVVVGGGGASGDSGSSWAGAGGGGGGLAWKNNIQVTPGESLTIVVGAGGTNPSGNGGESNINRSGTFLVRASGGTGGTSTNSQLNGGAGGTIIVGDGGGTGGTGGRTGSNTGGGGGGGAAGYSGNGGDGGAGNSDALPGTAGAGGGGGGGEGTSAGSRGGGGVGLQGQGTSGAYGASGNGGSGGTNGAIATTSGQLTGGVYGGGGGAEEDDTTITGTRGGQGAVRIIWGGNRAFPSTNTADGQGTTTGIILGNKKNSGIWNLKTTSARYNYEARYGNPNYTITTIPSTDTGVVNSNDVLIAIDANISSTDAGVLIDLGGNAGSGLAVGVSNGILRARAFDSVEGTEILWNTGTATTYVEADISAYTGSAATYYVTVDVATLTMKVYVQPGGKGSAYKKILLGSNTAVATTTAVYGSDGKGYGQASLSVPDLGSAYEVNFTGTINEIRYWAEDNLFTISNFDFD